MSLLDPATGKIEKHILPLQDGPGERGTLATCVPRNPRAAMNNARAGHAP